MFHAVHSAIQDLRQVSGYQAINSVVIFRKCCFPRLLGRVCARQEPFYMQSFELRSSAAV